MNNTLKKQRLVSREYNEMIPVPAVVERSSNIAMAVISFRSPFPARSAVAVKTIQKGALVEIECIAAS